MGYIPLSGQLSLQSASKFMGWPSHKLDELASYSNVYAKYKPVYWDNYTASVSSSMFSGAYYMYGIKIPYTQYPDYNEIDNWSYSHNGAGSSLLGFRGYDNTEIDVQYSQTYYSNYITGSSTTYPWDNLRDDAGISITFKFTDGNGRLLSVADFSGSVLNLWEWYPAILVDDGNNTFIGGLNVNRTVGSYIQSTTPVATIGFNVTGSYNSSTGVAHSMTVGSLTIVPIFINGRPSTFYGGGSSLTWVNRSTPTSAKIIMVGNSQIDADYNGPS